MRTFAIDTTGQIDVNSRSLLVVENADALKEIIQQKYSMFLGEYFLDQRRGVPYYENILIKQFNAQNVETILKRVLYDIEDVYGINSFELDFSNSNRSLSVSFECSTKFGDITDEVVI